jgi:hypothetical protein
MNLVKNLLLATRCKPLDIAQCLGQAKSGAGRLEKKSRVMLHNSE